MTTLKLKVLYCQEGATTHHCACTSGRCSKLVQLVAEERGLYPGMVEKHTQGSFTAALKKLMLSKELSGCLEGDRSENREESGGCGVQMRAGAV